MTLGSDDGAPMTGISFHDAHGSASAAFDEGAGLAVRRTRLQSRMAARAAEMGIEMHWGASVRAVKDGGFASAGKSDSSGVLCHCRRAVLDAWGSKRVPRAQMP